MIATSQRFLRAIRDSHTVSVAASLFSPSDPETPISAQVIGGLLTCDIDAQVLRQASLEVAFSLADPVTVDFVRELPFGGYATIERGVQFADGTAERVQLGRFRVDAVTWRELQGQATLTLNDRSAQIRDEPFVTPWSPSGLTPSDAIVQAVHDVFGDAIAYHVTTTPASEPILQDVIYDEDRAAAISDLASGVGAQAFFDHLGDFVLRPRPDVTSGSSPVWTIDAGADGVLVSAEESLDRSSVRNAVAMRASADPELPPIYSLATDDDADSPTRWGGPFGHVAMIARSSSIATQEAADSAAASLLNLRLGLSRTLAIVGVPNPALVPGDVVQIVHADGRSELQVVNSLALDLAAEGQLQITTRANWRPQPVGRSLVPPLPRPLRAVA